MGLTISSRYLPAIREGSKTSTLRLGLVPVRPGETTLLSSKTEMRIHVTKVTRLKWGSLTEADAVMDGFANLAELKEAARAHYGNCHIDNKTDVTKIEFAYLGECQKGKSGLPYYGR